jgi:hypothetical protein
MWQMNMLMQMNMCKFQTRQMNLLMQMNKWNKMLLQRSINKQMFLQ